jgi:flagellar motor switch protein FliM
MLHARIDIEMTTTTQELETELELLIDKSTLENVLEALANVCHAKTDHLLSNWQDKGQAREWSRAARQIQTLAAKVQI